MRRKPKYAFFYVSEEDIVKIYERGNVWLCYIIQSQLDLKLPEYDFRVSNSFYNKRRDKILKAGHYRLAYFKPDKRYGIFYGC